MPNLQPKPFKIPALFGARPPQVGGGSAPFQAQTGFAAASPAPSNTTGNPRSALVAALAGGKPDVASLIPLLQELHKQKSVTGKTPAAAGRPHSQGTSPAAARSSAATVTGSGGHGINELFYDPLGGIKHGQKIGAIGGHKDHVHISLASENAQKAALAQARAMGLHVGEDLDSNVHPVHVNGSYHYQHYRKGDPLRKAADVSGAPGAMAAFYRWVARHFR